MYSIHNIQSGNNCVQYPEHKNEQIIYHQNPNIYIQHNPYYNNEQVNQIPYQQNQNTYISPPIQNQIYVPNYVNEQNYTEENTILNYIYDSSCEKIIIDKLLLFTSKEILVKLLDFIKPIDFKLLVKNKFDKLTNDQTTFVNHLIQSIRLDKLVNEFESNNYLNFDQYEIIKKILYKMKIDFEQKHNIMHTENHNVLVLQMYLKDLKTLNQNDKNRKLFYLLI